ncbi:MAG TPA: GNAT family N-acetyltransferase [Mycobacterium sp.]|nr:GNAT family N-acetyltransferase [Mycobacterium sp.]
MIDQDRAAVRREIDNALVTALERRHEVADAIVEAEDRAEALEAITAVLGTSRLGAEAVIGMSFDKFTKESRRKIAAELDDLNKQLTFTLGERPASTGEGVTLRPFAGTADRDIFSARTDDMDLAGDGSGGPAGSVDDEIRSGLGRIDAEDAVWLVALAGTEKVGMVFGELAGGEVNVRVWIHPVHRKKGYGTAALRKCRSEMASYFPAVPMVVRAPGIHPG